MKLRAPAKVNLSLRILGKRPDGFHEIETLMTPISLADDLEITIAPGNDIVVTSDDPSLPTGLDNLAARAADVFFHHTKLHRQTRIHLTKRIPHGAGLGGGSSDAAAVLRGLDGLCETDLPTKTLEQLAATIGSDVPFFVRGQAAWARGRGEQIEPAPPVPDLSLLLVKPSFGVDTPWAYQSWANSQPLPGGPTDPQSVENIELVNDLERPVFQKFILLPVIKRWLLEQPGTQAALMSGSGSTLFAICDSTERAEASAEQAREHFGPNSWVATASTGNL